MPDNPILAHISEKLVQYAKPIKRWVVAYSGGIDSTVLLHAVVQANARLAKPLPIVALHINHQLSQQATIWEQHCYMTATEIGVESVSCVVDVIRKGKGVEEAARDARYQAFEHYLQKSDCLLLGHHQYDQAETVLLRLLRGAGVLGLTAMPESRRLGYAQLLRPFLTLDKEHIYRYAEQQQLRWVDDDSNAKDDVDRNFLRNQVVPLLSQRWPTVHRQLSKVAERMVKTDALLSEVAAEDLLLMDVQQARVGFSLDFKIFSRLSLERKNNLLRYWCHSVGYSLPNTDQLFQVEQQLFRRNALLNSACVSWSTVELRQFSGRLYLQTTLSEFKESHQCIEWDGCSDVSLGGAGTLRVAEGCNDDLGVSLRRQPYHIRWRQGGERCTPSDRQHSQTVKKLLQEYGLETWLRDRVPLIYDGDQLVAVGDLWVNKEYDIVEPEAAIRINWVL